MLRLCRIGMVLEVVSILLSFLCCPAGRGKLARREVHIRLNTEDRLLYPSAVDAGQTETIIILSLLQINESA